MKLVLHIGAHKTATTSIQRALAKSRTELVKSGIWYPGYSEVFSDVKDHYAHLDVAKGLMSDSERFTPDMAGQFFEGLYRRAPKVRGVDTVLVSAEPFYRGVMPGESAYWKRRAGYVAKVRSSIPFEDVEVVLVLRRQDDYLESLYNEHVKVTRYSKDIWSFFGEYQSRFQYQDQIKVWSEHFPAFKVLTFEELIEKRSPARSFVAAVLGRDVPLEEAERENNASLPVDLIEFKRLLNGTPLSRPELREVVSGLESIAAGRAAAGGSDRTSRLSVEDRRRVLAQFDGDNEWVNRTYFADRPGGLFPADVKVRPIAPDLDLKSCMEIVAEILRQRVLSHAQRGHGPRAFVADRCDDDSGP